VAPDVECHLIAPRDRFWNVPELTSLDYDSLFVREVMRRVPAAEVAFVYQRHSVNSRAGLRLATVWRRPLVIEYNGSEVWMSRHWGKPLRHEALSARIERLALGRADLVVAVSEAMRDELVGIGVDPARILINPNGVDPKRYAPDVDGSAVRDRYGLRDKLVIGFIGTFGPWHGAEVLADAFSRLVDRVPATRRDVRLLMIGDGPMVAETRRRLEEGRVSDLTVFTGRTRQEEGPAYLAAADILVSPHVPNADGTPFFGSPTKLFEYMAMGRAIVASDLYQIGDLLEHGRTAWLVSPGDADELAEGLRAVIEDAFLRHRLAVSARSEVVAKHTWRAHTRRIVEALETRCG
jgi:glycosyltransferase involved in cell wall biosynthesis